MDPASN
jgi:polo-like kinase 1